jgi:hypothetical protein
MSDTYVEIKYRCENFRMSWHDYSAFASVPEFSGIGVFKPRRDGLKGIVELDDKTYLKFGRELIRQDVLISGKNDNGIQYLFMPRKNDAESIPSPNRVSIDEVVEAETVDPAVEAFLEENPNENLSDTKLLINITKKMLNKEMGYVETKDGAPIYVGKQ